jgi:hypothetical protein
MKKFFGGKKTYNPFFSIIMLAHCILFAHWAQRNHLQDYKIYATVISIFDDDFFNNLLHPIGDNLWPAHPTNWKYKT